MPSAYELTRPSHSRSKRTGLHTPYILIIRQPVSKGRIAFAIKYSMQPTLAPAPPMQSSAQVRGSLGGNLRQKPVAACANHTLLKLTQEQEMNADNGTISLTENTSSTPVYRLLTSSVRRFKSTARCRHQHFACACF